MKKFLSILLIALLLCGVVGVAAGAAAPALPKAAAIALPGIPSLDSILKNFNLASMTDAQLSSFIKILSGLKSLGVDLSSYLAPIAKGLPIPVKAALQQAGLMQFPIWERSYFFNFIFKWLLFGWIWM